MATSGDSVGADGVGGYGVNAPGADTSSAHGNSAHAPDAHESSAHQNSVKAPGVHQNGVEQGTVGEFEGVHTVSRKGFRISVPESWWEFDIHPQSRNDTIRQLVNERVRAFPELADHRGDLERFLRDSAAQAWNSGALYCGCMAESYDGELTVTGSVTLSVVGARTADGELLSTDPAQIVGELRQWEAKREGDSWRSVTTVELPDVGPAARTFGVEDIEIPGERRNVRAVLMQTFVPVPGSAGTVALVAGSSRNVELAESFFDIFDAVTSTLRFT